MTDPAPKDQYGSASIDPTGEVIAGSHGTWKFTCVVGPKGIASQGAIRLDTECDTDWGIPQLGDPATAEYMTVAAPEDARVCVLVEGVKSVLLVVKGRALQPGEHVVVTYGDRTGGGPGSMAQTFLEGRRYFRVAVDAMADGVFHALEDQPYVTVVGGQAVDLVGVAPSTVVAGRPFRLLVRAVDRWGNPSSAYRGTVEIQAGGVSIPVARHTFGSDDRGVHSIRGCTVAEPGVRTIELRDREHDLAARSNPVLCVDRPSQHALYWGDPHGGQVADRAKIRDFFHYARDVAGLDFVGYQRNDHLVSKEDWTEQQRVEADFTEPGRFIPLPGFEWSADTDRGGHHNLYSRRHDLPIRRNSHEGVADKSDIDTDLTHILDVYRAYRGSDVVLTPHVGGSHSDLTFHEPTLEPALEIVSTHGTFEWFLEETLRHGYKMGFLGGSDCHTGRPGTDNPGHQARRYAKSGLAGVYATDVSLEAFIDALRARRCYATTGARIMVRVDCDGRLMGEEYTTSSRPTISVSIAGTAPLESVELFRGLERVHTHAIGTSVDPRRVRILWTGASRKTSYSGAIWDGRVSVTGAGIASIEKMRFDSPRSYLHDVTAEGLRWHSVTCGYTSGVVLTLDGGDDIHLNAVVATSVISRPAFGEHGEVFLPKMSYSPSESLAFDLDLRDLDNGPREFDLGVLDRKVSVSLAPTPGGPETAEFSFTDPTPRPGTNPYWVRVVQTDMEMAWSSPVFVDFAGT